MNSIVTKDNSVAIENGRVITQVSCDKCFYVVTKFSACDQLKAGFLSRQRKLYRDKEISVVTKVEKQYKEECCDKEVLCCDIMKN